MQTQIGTETSVSITDCDSTMLIVWKKGDEVIMRYRLTPSGLEHFINQWHVICSNNPKFAHIYPNLIRRVSPCHLDHHTQE